MPPLLSSLSSPPSQRRRGGEEGAPQKSVSGRMKPEGTPLSLLFLACAFSNSHGASWERHTLTFAVKTKQRKKIQNFLTKVPLKAFAISSSVYDNSALLVLKSGGVLLAGSLSPPEGAAAYLNPNRRCRPANLLSPPLFTSLLFCNIPASNKKEVGKETASPWEKREEKNQSWK